MVEDIAASVRWSRIETERDGDQRSRRNENPAMRHWRPTFRAACDGDVRFDEYARVLYATDGSIYGAQPAGVVIPAGHCRRSRSRARCGRLRRAGPAARSGLIARRAGRRPNCVVLDLSRHMDGIRSIDPDERTAVVQPGVVQDDLDAALEPHGLKFPPDPPPQTGPRSAAGSETTRRCTLGALRHHGRLRRGMRSRPRRRIEDRTRDVVLDGPEWERIVSKDDREAAIYRTVRRLVEDNAAEIEERYPKLKRSVSGYNLQKVIRTDG